MTMRRAALFVFFAAVPFFRPASVVAAPAAASVNFTVSCDCSDTTGKAYGAAIKSLLAQDSEWKQVGAEEGARTGAINIHITSTTLQPADGMPRVALSVAYTHGGRSMQQLIQTCTHVPVTLSAALLVQSVKQLEQEPADAPEQGEILSASLR